MSSPPPPPRGPSASSITVWTLAGFTLSTVLTLVAAIATAYAFRKLAVEPFELHGANMEPSYVDGDRVIVGRQTQGGLGDVIVFTASDGRTLIKRIVGVAGDRVAIENGRVVRNGEALPVTELSSTDEVRCLEETLDGHRYRIQEDVGGSIDDMAAMHVPAGHVFVLSDNRPRTVDSRTLGPVPIDDVGGRVTSQYYRAPDRGPCGTP